MSKTVAIVGASQDRRKYGNKAVRAFRDGGWTVYPIHPTETTIEGLPCYSTLQEVPERIDRVSLYVPPQIGKKLLDDIAAVNPEEVFLNPVTEDDELVAQAKEKGLNVVQACSMVNIGLRPDMYPDE